MLYREQTLAPRAFHSELQQTKNKQTQSARQSAHRKACLEPAIRDAQKLAQNVFPPEEQGMVFRVLDRNPLQ